jgi:hypothetical protein
LAQIFSSTPSDYVPLLLSETMFRTHLEPQAKLVLYILIFTFFLAADEKVEGSGLECFTLSKKEPATAGAVLKQKGLHSALPQNIAHF